MVDANALMNAGLLVATGLAFSKLARYELLKRDKWTCQNEQCVGYYMNLGALQYRDGWKDEKPPIFWYYDWVKADERGKLGLAQAYVEMFGLNETD